MRVFLLLFLGLSCVQSSAALKLQAGKILRDDGRPVAIHGFNYFGFNNGQTMLDGLWSNNALSGDFATVVRRQKLLGFNSVRIPFSFKDFQQTPRSFVHQSCPLPSDMEVARSVTPPDVPVLGPAPPLPNPPPASAYEGNVCNAYLPNSSVRERLIYVIRFYISNGFVVMLDNHLREDQTALNSPEDWLRQWTDLARDLVADDPLVRDNLIIDLLNEPDNFGVSWATLKGLYISAMDAIDRAVGGDVLYAVEGTGQGLLNANWGDGFATERIDELGIQDAGPFFDALLTRPYKDRVILAPHVYPPSVTNNNNAVTGSALIERLDLSFGTKTKAPGYCDGDVCQRFPVMLGEFGSHLVDAKDKESLSDLARYINDMRLGGWYWWSWNANSGDTGGLVEDNWTSIVWRKISYLRTIGLGDGSWGDWSGDGDSPSPNLPSPTPTPSPKPQPMPTPKPSASCRTSSSRKTCQVKIKTENSWTESGTSNADFRITIRNKDGRWVFETDNPRVVCGGRGGRGICVRAPRPARSLALSLAYPLARQARPGRLEAFNRRWPEVQPRQAELGVASLARQTVQRTTDQRTLGHERLAVHRRLRGGERRRPGAGDLETAPSQARLAERRQMQHDIEVFAVDHSIFVLVSVSLRLCLPSSRLRRRPVLVRVRSQLRVRTGSTSRPVFFI